MSNPFAAMSDSNVFVLSRINKSLRSDFQHLADADFELQAMLKDAREFGERVVPSQSSNVAWVGNWGKIDALIDGMRSYALRMKEELDSEAASSLAEFSTVTMRDEELHRNLYEVAAQLDHALSNPEDRADWIDLWESLQAHLDVIRAYLAGTRARIEMRRKHGRPETERMQQEILSQLPADASLEKAGQFSEEYESALQQFQRDKHRTGGLVDVFKALLLIQDEGPIAKVARHQHEVDV